MPHHIRGKIYMSGNYDPKATNFFITPVAKALVNYMGELKENSVDTFAEARRIPISDEGEQAIRMDRITEVHITEAGRSYGRLIHLQSFVKGKNVPETVVYVGPEYNAIQAETVAREEDTYTHRIYAISHRNKSIPDEVRKRQLQIAELYAKTPDAELVVPLNSEDIAILNVDEVIQEAIDRPTGEIEVQIDVAPPQAEDEYEATQTAEAYLEGRVKDTMKICEEGIVSKVTLANASSMGLNSRLIRIGMTAVLTATLDNIADIEYNRLVAIDDKFAFSLGSRDELQPYLNMADARPSREESVALVKDLKKALENRDPSKEEFVYAAKKLLAEAKAGRHVRMRRFCEDHSEKLTFYRLDEPTLEGLRKHVFPQMGSVVVHMSKEETVKGFAEMLLERRDNAEIERRFDEAECSFQLDGLKLYVVSEKARVAFKSRVIARVEENEKLQEDLELYLKEFIKDPSDKDAEIVDLDEFRKRASGEKN